MRKFLPLLCCIMMLLLLVACDNSHNVQQDESNDIQTGNPNTENEEIHQHEWSALVCGSKQYCLICNEEKEDIVEHKWSEPVCEQKQICLICGKTQKDKVEHEWSEPICEQKQVCKKCNEQSENIVSHTTDRGNCERCGEYYISKDNQIADENARHEKVLADLYEHYSALYDSHYNNYETYSALVSYSESYIYSRMATLRSSISDLQFKVTMASLDQSYQGQLKYNNLKRQLDEAEAEYNILVQEQSYYNQINSSYESMIAVQNQYNIEKENENKLHEENLAKITQDNVENDDSDNTQNFPIPTICEHEFDDWNDTKSATCTEEGCSERICSKCFIKEYRTLSTIPHTEVIDKEIAPTRTTTGLTEGSHCSVCNTVLKEQEIIPIPLFNLTIISNDGQTHTKSLLYQDAFDWDGWLVREGYTLGGLFCDDALTDEFTLDTMPKNNITLYVWWKEENKPSDFTYTIYDASGYVTINSYIGTDASVVVPAYIKGVPVKRVAGSAFKNNTNLISLVLPQNITTINNGILQGCNNIESLSVPFIGKDNKASVSLDENYILGYFFETQTLRYDVAAPTNWICQGAKYNLYEYKIYANIPSSLEKITITNASYIGANALSNCTMLKEVVLEGQIHSIYKNAFSNCSQMSIAIESNDIVEIGDNAFNNTLITRAVMPELIHIGENVFSNCKVLTTVTVSSEIEKIPIGTFSGCVNLVSLNEANKISIPQSVKEIGAAAFAGCSSIKSINGETGQLVLHDGVTEIGNLAFSGLNLITEIHIPSSVTSIGMGAFGGCDALESITIPFVGHNYYTYSDAKLNATGWEADWVNSIFGYIFGYESAYQNAELEKENLVYQGTGYTKIDALYIGDKVYYNVSSYNGYRIPQTLKNVTISNASVISANAFYNCSMIEKITFLQSNVTFYKNALYNCSAEIIYQSQ